MSELLYFLILLASQHSKTNIRKARNESSEESSEDSTSTDSESFPTGSGKMIHKGNYFSACSCVFISIGIGMYVYSYVCTL